MGQYFWGACVKSVRKSKIAGDQSTASINGIIINDNNNIARVFWWPLIAGTQLPAAPLFLQDAVQRRRMGRKKEKRRRGAACLQGLCPVAMANALNGTTPTSQLQFAPSFRSVPKGSLGPRARPSGQIMGGERRGQLGAKERGG